MDILKHIQRGVTASEIVHPDLESQASEPFHLLLHEIKIAPDHTFRDLYGQQLPAEPRSIHLTADLFHHITGVKIRPGQVHGGGYHVEPGILLDLHLLQDLIHHIQIHFIDQPCILQHRDKVCRRQHPLDGIDPPGQSLLITYLSGSRTDNGLVKGLNPAFLQCLIQMIDHVLPSGLTFQHGCIKSDVSRLPDITYRITCIPRPVTGKAGFHDPHGIRIDTDTDGSPSFPGHYLIFQEQAVQRLIQMVRQSKKCKVILRDPAGILLSEVLHQKVRKKADQLISFIESVFLVIELHAVQIRKAKRTVFP